MSTRVSLLLALLTLVTVLVVTGAATAQEPTITGPAPLTPPTVVVEVEGGFHWLDAGLGAVAAVATALLVVGLALTVRNNERSNG